ncbi:MAG: septal ring lytic transglycosylase RlpA family protein [Bradyrhizobiaceae bacterium]|nr:septal ring lytic transglycosylase RlpA family protein [Bradyrhizobiaceae bacterium]
MSSLRIVAATAALCLFAHSTTTSAKNTHEDGALSHSRKHKISFHHRISHHQRADKAHSRSRRFSAHHRSRKYAVRRKLHRLASRPEPRSVPPGARDFTGIASYYWEGSRVADGGRFDPQRLTAAHRTLPFGTRLWVTDLTSQRSIIVTINDRGPFVRNRILDLSLGAAKALGMTARGVARVRAVVI